MKKLLIIPLILSLFVIAGCSTKQADQTSKQNDNGPVNNAVDKIDTEGKEAHDQYLIAKASQIDTAVQLYAMDHDKSPIYPVITGSDGKPAAVKIYNGSDSWNKLKAIILSSQSNKDTTLDINETLTANQPIEYFSNGDMYTFKVYLNYDKNYHLLDKDFKCQTKEGSFCVLTLSSEE